MFEKKVYAGWGDLDANGHMANTAYLDKAADTRMGFFATHGFHLASFRERGIGPVIRKDEIEYFAEFVLLEPLRVTISCRSMSEDGSRFTLVNEFFKEDGRLAARVTSSGGWLDLASRKLIAPPPDLLAAMRLVPVYETKGA